MDKAAALFIAAWMLSACAPAAKSDSFAAQALQRGDDCKSVAAGRAMDAYANGFDREMIDRIYAGTYQDCIAWRAKTHPTS